MYATTGIESAGVADPSTFVVFTLVFLLAYFYLVEPLSVDGDLRLGLVATGLSLFVVFVAIVTIEAGAA